MDNSPHVLVQFIVSGAPADRNTDLEIRGSCFQLADWGHDGRDRRNVALFRENKGDWTLLVALDANSKIEWKATVHDVASETVQWENLLENRSLQVPDIPELHQVFRVSAVWNCPNFECTFHSMHQLAADSAETVLAFKDILPPETTALLDQQQDQLEEPEVPHNSVMEDSTSTLEEAPDANLYSRQTSSQSNREAFKSYSFAKDSLDVDDSENQMASAPPTTDLDLPRPARRFKFGEFEVRDSLDIAMSAEQPKRMPFHLTSSSPIQEDADSESSLEVQEVDELRDLFKHRTEADNLSAPLAPTARDPLETASTPLDDGPADLASAVAGRSDGDSLSSTSSASGAAFAVKTEVPTQCNSPKKEKNAGKEQAEIPSPQPARRPKLFGSLCGCVGRRRR